LAISVPTANVRNVLGVDNGDTESAWKTALDATNPTTIAVGVSASPGTSLTFAHRDHTHGAPATWAPAAHNLLSASHSGTTAASAVRGDIITGQGASPLWARLALTVPAANVRNVLGIDNAETEPAWKTALDATAPTTLNVSTSSSPGTSLIFAHRDHAHAITSSSSPGASASILASDASGFLKLVGLGLGSGAPVTAGHLVAVANSSGTLYWTLQNTNASGGTVIRVINDASVTLDMFVGGSSAVGNPNITALVSSGDLWLGAGGLKLASLSTGGVFDTPELSVAGGTAYTSISASPGAAAAILASTAAGALTLGGLLTVSGTGLAAQFNRDYLTDNNTARTVVVYRRDYSSGAGAAGIGATVGFELKNDTGIFTAAQWIINTTAITAGAESALMNFVTVQAGALVTRASIGLGLQIGSPTGGDKGSGTINTAADIYKNNSAYNNPDFVLEQWMTGRIERYAERPRANDYRRMSLGELESYVKEHWCLPRIGNDPVGIFDMADIALEKIEELTTYLIEIGHRIRKLEERIA